MRLFLMALALMLSVSCKSTAVRYHARPASFVVPSFDEEGGADDSEDSVAMLRESKPNCEQEADAIRCVHFVKNDDAQSIVVALPPSHPQAGKTITVRLAGIEPLNLKAPELCERVAAQKAKRRMTEALQTAQRIDLMKWVKLGATTFQADVEVDGHSLAALLEDEKLVRALGSIGKADWCEAPRPN